MDPIYSVIKGSCFSLQVELDKDELQRIIEEMKEWVVNGFYCQLLGTSSILIDFSLTVKGATLIFISGCGSAISSAKQGKSVSIYNLMKNK